LKERKETVPSGTLRQIAFRSYDRVQPPIYSAQASPCRGKWKHGWAGV